MVSCGFGYGYSTSRISPSCKGEIYALALGKFSIIVAIRVAGRGTGRGAGRGAGRGVGKVASRVGRRQEGVVRVNWR